MSNRIKYQAGIIIIAALCALVFPGRACADDKRDEWFAQDKAEHFVAGFLLETLAYNVYIRNFNSESKAKTAAVCTSLAVGAAKEFSDEEFSWKDFAWDAAGAGFGFAVSIEF
ncbi:MAG: hypothetical protein PHO30_01265 [Candidatus Omnitrophica bacterium]|nr:hypothetical protein [Candidatus Omnitrophota bacterium]